MSALPCLSTADSSDLKAMGLDSDDEEEEEVMTSNVPGAEETNGTSMEQDDAGDGQASAEADSEPAGGGNYEGTGLDSSDDEEFRAEGEGGGGGSQDQLAELGFSDEEEGAAAPGGGEGETGARRITRVRRSWKRGGGKGEGLARRRLSCIRSLTRMVVRTESCGGGCYGTARRDRALAAEGVDGRGGGRGEPRRSR